MAVSMVIPMTVSMAISLSIFTPIVVSMAVSMVIAMAIVMPDVSSVGVFVFSDLLLVFNEMRTRRIRREREGKRQEGHFLTCKC